MVESVQTVSLYSSKPQGLQKALELILQRKGENIGICDDCMNTLDRQSCDNQSEWGVDGSGTIIPSTLKRCDLERKDVVWSQKIFVSSNTVISFLQSRKTPWYQHRCALSTKSL